MIEESSQPTGAYIFYTTFLFCTLFLINLLLPLGYLLHMPLNFFIFATPSSQLLFVTQFHDSCLRLIFVNQFCDSHL